MLPKRKHILILPWHQPVEGSGFASSLNFSSVTASKQHLALHRQVKSYRIYLQYLSTSRRALSEFCSSYQAKQRRERNISVYMLIDHLAFPKGGLLKNQEAINILHLHNALHSKSEFQTIGLSKSHVTSC